MTTPAVSKFLIDTCVWLDLARDQRQQTLLALLAELITEGRVELILPRTIVDEFAANKARVAAEGRQSLSAALRRAKEVVDGFGIGKGKRVALKQLNEIDHRLSLLGPTAVESLKQIEALFARSTVLEIPDDVKLRAAERAINRKAPFHRQRNGIADAILIELYGGLVLAQGTGRTRFAFVTHNIKDFSCPDGDHRQPHPDVAPYFSRIKSRFFIRLAQALQSVSGARVSDLLLVDEFEPEPRALREIVDAIGELVDKVWYDRHMLTEQRIERGLIQLVDQMINVRRSVRGFEITRSVLKGARKGAKRMERKYGVQNLGPYSKFDWGMLNGKLSALRWVLGDDWDMLDT